MYMPGSFGPMPQPLRSPSSKSSKKPVVAQLLWHNVPGGGRTPPAPLEPSMSDEPPAPPMFDEPSTSDEPPVPASNGEPSRLDPPAPPAAPPLPAVEPSPGAPPAPAPASSKADARQCWR